MLYVIKVLYVLTYICFYFRPFKTFLLIYAPTLGHLKCIKDASFVKSIRKKFQPQNSLFTKDISSYIIVNMHYVSLKNNFQNFEHL